MFPTLQFTLRSKEKDYTLTSTIYRYYFHFRDKIIANGKRVSFILYSFMNIAFSIHISIVLHSVIMVPKLHCYPNSVFPNIEENISEVCPMPRF